ncbi:MAG: hypothetical protein IJK02_11025 [Clostridia bacterium]|nr:hypothetical protein [Clostridia bacterium]
MEYGYSILMFIFSGMLLLYAGIIAIKRDPMLLPYARRNAAKMGNPKKYMLKVAKILALPAGAPLARGVSGLFTDTIVPMLVLVGTMVLCLWAGVYLTKNDDETFED